MKYMNDFFGGRSGVFRCTYPSLPQPNRRLPIAYQRIGIRIGDVGIITPEGGSSFLFNICAPPDDSINPCILPEDFSPLQPALTEVDVVEFSRFNPGSYLASESIKKKESKSNTKCVALNSSMPLINDTLGVYTSKDPRLRERY